MPPKTKAPRWIRAPEERPQSLLDAAVEVFSTYGYRATRLEQVAELAGVTKGTIYYYFDTKEDLLTQALESRVEVLFGGVEAESRNTEGTAADRLRATLRAAWDRWRMPETARMYRLIFGELRTEFPELFGSLMRRGPMRLWRLIAEILREGQQQGEFTSQVDPQLVTPFLMSGLMHQAVLQTELRATGLRMPDSDRLFEGSLAVVMSGVLANARPASGGAGAASGRRRRS